MQYHYWTIPLKTLLIWIKSRPRKYPPLHSFVTSFSASPTWRRRMTCRQMKKCLQIFLISETFQNMCSAGTACSRHFRLVRQKATCPQIELEWLYSSHVNLWTISKALLLRKKTGKNWTWGNQIHCKNLFWHWNVISSTWEFSKLFWFIFVSSLVMVCVTLTVMHSQ